MTEIESIYYLYSQQLVVIINIGSAVEFISISLASR